MISFKKQYCFIHISKTGGSSIKLQLQHYDKDIIFPTDKPHTTLDKMHSEIQTRFYSKFKTYIKNMRVNSNRINRMIDYEIDYKEVLSQAESLFKIDNFFIFTIVRNPWDRMVSWYCYHKHTRRHKLVKDLTFLDFIRYSIKSTEPNKFKKTFKLIKQMDIIQDINKISFIGRYENLQNDWKIICDNIKFPHHTLPHQKKYKRTKEHYRDYYDDKTKDLVYENYKQDIDTFNYSF